LQAASILSSNTVTQVCLLKPSTTPTYSWHHKHCTICLVCGGHQQCGCEAGIVAQSSRMHRGKHKPHALPPCLAPQEGLPPRGPAHISFCVAPFAIHASQEVYELLICNGWNSQTSLMYSCIILCLLHTYQMYSCIILCVLHTYQTCASGAGIQFPATSLILEQHLGSTIPCTYLLTVLCASLPRPAD
jgi:hypothetical protein